ncbi:hypothetical protein [Heyndrickxia acidiproducens]|nr:hypothetical protein [Heyndrickxia acidiproducens]
MRASESSAASKPFDLERGLAANFIMVGFSKKIFSSWMHFWA